MCHFATIDGGACATPKPGLSSQRTHRSNVSVGQSQRQLATATSAVGSLTWVLTKSSLSFMETLPTATPMHSTFFSWNLTEDLISFTCRQVAGPEDLEQPCCCYLNFAAWACLDTALMWADHCGRQATSCSCQEPHT